LSGEPVDRRDQTIGEHLNVKAELARHVVHILFFAGEEVEEQRSQSGIAKNARNEAVAAAEPAAAASMRKKHHSTRPGRNAERSF
jgi:hypothetical protein